MHKSIEMCGVFILGIKQGDATMGSGQAESKRVGQKQSRARRGGEKKAKGKEVGDK